MDRIRNGSKEQCMSDVLQRKSERPDGNVLEDMKLVDVREEDAEDRVRWRQMICCGNP